MTSAVLGARSLWARYLRRFPSARAIPPSFFRRRSLFGHVTAVGDGDGLRLFHTPGGRLTGWGWLRRMPTGAGLHHQTLAIRLAGVDAPEAAHFGHSAQPGAQEAREELARLVLNRRVRVYLWRRDQYERAVGTVMFRRGIWGWVRRTDAGKELLKKGLATVYEAKSGVEFGGEAREREYRRIEQRAKGWKRGIWGTLGDGNGPRESPMEFKKRMRELEEART